MSLMKNQPKSDAALVKGLLERGDHPDRIGRWLGAPNEWIMEIVGRQLYAEVEPAPPEYLPPYHHMRPGRDLINEMTKDLEALQDALNTLLEKWEPNR
jgi:hypothetical protein